VNALAIEPGPLMYALRARADCLGAGVEVKRRALGLGWSTREAEELCLVVIELGTNAVRHAGSGTLTIVLEPRRCQVQCEDRGGGLSPAVLADCGQTDGASADGPRIPGERRPGLGSGLAAVRRLTDRLEMFNKPTQGAIVRAEKKRRSSSK
jgi:anti-sigma regulatory factor (Ser/Thr protein kinase)